MLHPSGARPKEVVERQSGCRTEWLKCGCQLRTRRHVIPTQMNSGTRSSGSVIPALGSGGAWGRSGPAWLETVVLENPSTTMHCVVRNSLGGNAAGTQFHLLCDHAKPLR